MTELFETFFDQHKQTKNITICLHHDVYYDLNIFLGSNTETRPEISIQDNQGNIIQRCNQLFALFQRKSYPGIHFTLIVDFDTLQILPFITHLNFREFIICSLMHEINRCNSEYSQSFCEFEIHFTFDNDPQPIFIFDSSYLRYQINYFKDILNSDSIARYKISIYLYDKKIDYAYHLLWLFYSSQKEISFEIKAENFNYQHEQKTLAQIATLQEQLRNSTNLDRRDVNLQELGCYQKSIINNRKFHQHILSLSSPLKLYILIPFGLTPEGCLTPSSISNNWFSFLSQGLYDPRLLCLISSFL